MSSGPLYNIRESSTRSSRHGKVVAAYVIDRVPQGPLADYVESQDLRDACDPCGSSMSSSSRIVPERHAILLPEEVKRAYTSPLKTDYVDPYTLPGFISWVMENGYDTVDMKHIVGLEQGFWIQYSDSTAEEFRGLTAKKNPLVRTGPSAARSVSIPQPKPPPKPEPKRLEARQTHPPPVRVKGGKSNAKHVAKRVAVKPAALARVGTRRHLR